METRTEYHTQDAGPYVEHIPNLSRERVIARTKRPYRILWEEQFELDGMPFFMVLTTHGGPYVAFKLGWAKLPYDPHDPRVAQCIEWAAKIEHLQEVDAAFGDDLEEMIRHCEQAIFTDEQSYESLALRAETILDSRFASPSRRQIAMRALDLAHSLQHKKHQPGFVYVLKGGTYYKIGCTTNLDRRIKQISPALPFPVDLVHTIETEDMYRTEAYLHEKHADKRQNGEWFLLTDQDVIDIKGLPS